MAAADYTCFSPRGELTVTNLYSFIILSTSPQKSFTLTLVKLNVDSLCCRALHWVTIQMLCVSMDEEIPEVSENVVKAITGQKTINQSEVIFFCYSTYICKVLYSVSYSPTYTLYYWGGGRNLRDRYPNKIKPKTICMATYHEGNLSNATVTTHFYY